MELIMKVEITDRTHLQKLLYKDFPYKNCAVISFYGEGEKDVNFSINPKVKYIKKNIDDLRWVEDPDNWHFPDFDQIAKFIIDCEKQGINYIICQCECGVSRSAGCAAAIREFYHHDGIKIFSIYDYSPNVVFFNNIYNALEKRHKINERKKLEENMNLSIKEMKQFIDSDFSMAEFIRVPKSVSGLKCDVYLYDYRKEKNGLFPQLKVDYDDKLITILINGCEQSALFQSDYLVKEIEPDVYKFVKNNNLVLLRHWAGEITNEEVIGLLKSVRVLRK